MRKSSKFRYMIYGPDSDSDQIHNGTWYANSLYGPHGAISVAEKLCKMTGRSYQIFRNEFVGIVKKKDFNYYFFNMEELK